MIMDTRFIKNMGAYLTFRLGHPNRMVSEVEAKPTKQVKQEWQQSKEIGGITLHSFSV